MVANNLVLGIDFGTTNTNAAWVDRRGEVHIVPVTDRSNVLPSVTWFKSRDRHVVGEVARQSILSDPHNTVFGIKRFLGRRFKSHFVTRNRGRYLFEICDGDEGMAAVKVHDEVISLVEVTSYMIRRILDLSNAASGEPFKQCVLTVPAHFSFSQRQALRQAAEMVGLQVRGLVNEPTAAALYCAKRRGVSQTILVYDLGGGTFDLSLVAIRGQLVLVLATGGDAFLGGANFDAQIAKRMAARFESEHKIDLQASEIVMQRMIFAAEQAKIALSEQESAKMTVRCVAVQDDGPLHFEQLLTRDSLETLTSNLIERTLGACDELLAKAEIDARAVDELVFVGGQTRMLPLRRRLSAAFHTEPSRYVHPELAVAVGAALLGRGLDLPGGPELVDVVSIPIGVMLPGGKTVEVIPSNTGIPCLRRVDLEVEAPPGHALTLALYEANDPLNVDRELLGTVQIEAGWLTGHSGPITLELRLGQDFELTTAVMGRGGERLTLAIRPPT